MIQWYHIIYCLFVEAWYVLLCRLKSCKHLMKSCVRSEINNYIWRFLWGAYVGDKSWCVVTEGLKFLVTRKLLRRGCGRVGLRDSCIILGWESQNGKTRSVKELSDHFRRIVWEEKNMEIPDKPPASVPERRAMSILGNYLTAEVRELDTNYFNQVGKFR